MITYLIQGGPLMIAIGAGSIAAGAFTVIAWLRLGEASKNTSQTIAKITQATAKRDWPEALQTLKQTAHPFFKSWQAGFSLLIEGKSDLRDIEEAVSIEGSGFMTYLESPIKSLGALVAVLPMLGFLGTILGLILSFQNWERMGAHVSISQLAGGIYQAMITTAAALIVAIPYHLLYHFFASWTQKLAYEFSKETTELFRKIKDALIHEAPMEAETVLSSKS
ncbi:MAG TPA: MotA/TolQ/ExbB proton channel family protein [Candidatus Omnitrophota bacterium]|nr:MotA/TolQ/ExbB proton channel family protein [Candidatus Omnitrophota bacterium]